MTYHMTTADWEALGTGMAVLYLAFRQAINQRKADVHRKELAAKVDAIKAKVAPDPGAANLPARLIATSGPDNLAITTGPDNQYVAK